LSSHFNVSGDTANAAEVDLVYPKPELSFLAGNNTGSPFTTALFNAGGGGRTLTVAAVLGGPGYNGDILFSNTTFRVGCTAARERVKFLPTTGIASGTTSEALPLQKIAKTLIVKASPPTKACAMPSTAGARAHARRIAVYGSKFGTKTKVSFGTGVTVTKVNVASRRELVATVDIASTARVGDRNITVTRANGTKLACRACFTVMTAPQPYSVDPNSVARGSSVTAAIIGSAMTYGFTMSVSGSGIRAVAGSSWTPARVDVQMTVAPNAPLGARNVTIRNPDGGIGVCSKCLTVTN
jgi:hypothetical protein